MGLEDKLWVCFGLNPALYPLLGVGEVGSPLCLTWWDLSQGGLLCCGNHYRVPRFLLLELSGCPQYCSRQQQLQNLFLLFLFWANNPFGQLVIDTFLHPHPSAKIVTKIFSFFSTNSCLTFSHPTFAWGVLTKNCGI